MNSISIQQKIVEFLVSATGQDSLHPETELQDSGIIDSLLMMDLLVFIEGQFGVRLEFQDLTPETFKTPATIARLVESRMT